MQKITLDDTRQIDEDLIILGDVQIYSRSIFMPDFSDRQRKAFKNIKEKFQLDDIEAIQLEIIVKILSVIYSPDLQIDECRKKAVDIYNVVHLFIKKVGDFNKELRFCSVSNYLSDDYRYYLSESYFFHAVFEKSTVRNIDDLLNNIKYVMLDIEVAMRKANNKNHSYDRNPFGVPFGMFLLLGNIYFLNLSNIFQAILGLLSCAISLPIISTEIDKLISANFRFSSYDKDITTIISDFREKVSELSKLSEISDESVAVVIRPAAALDTYLSLGSCFKISSGINP